MYCTNCGKKLIEQMKYCPYCGKTAENNMENNTNAKSSVKSEENSAILANLEVALPIYCTIADIQSKIDEQNKKKADVARISGLKLFIGIMLYVFILIITAALLSSLFFQSENVEYLFFMPAVVVLTGYGIYVSKTQSKTQKKIDELTQQMNVYIENNKCKELFYLPENYRYYMAASYIKECLKSGRAKDLSEALNLYEEQLHRWKMENMQYQIYLANMQQVILAKYKL